MDINLPGLNGIDLYHLITNINPNQKIIFITGYSNLNIPGIERENVYVIEKPFSSDILINTILKFYKN